jgi:hypothetical protein
MTLPEQALLKRRRQILDDETGGTDRFDTAPPDDTWAREAAWLKSLVARLSAVIRGASRHKQD